MDPSQKIQCSDQTVFETLSVIHVDLFHKPVARSLMPLTDSQYQSINDDGFTQCQKSWANQRRL